MKRQRLPRLVQHDWKVGDRLVMSVLGYERLVHHFRWGLTARATSGKFLGYLEKYRRFALILVLRDGHRKPNQYHSDFWEKAK